MKLFLVGNQGYLGAFLCENLRMENGEVIAGCDIKSGMEYKGGNMESEIREADIVIYLAGLSGRKQFFLGAFAADFLSSLKLELFSTDILLVLI